MRIQGHQKRIRVCVIAALIAVAYICRIPALWGRIPQEVGLLRSCIYIGLFFAWGVSLRSRIIQPQVRKHLTAIASLMVFWFLARTLKFHFVSDVTHPGLVRYLWYLYYLPMLFIPLLAAFVAISLGKPENFRMPKWVKLLYIPTALLLVLVLTNDLHQLVFTFPAEAAVWTDADYSHATGYILAGGWSLFCAFLTLGILFGKCRVPYVRKCIWRPGVFIAMLILYTLLYVLDIKWLSFFFGDMTAVHCLLYAATLESCIQSGLIQSNTHYEELFDAATISAQITDDDYHVFLSSKMAASVSPEVLRRTANGPVMIDNGIRLSGAPIHGGHVIWQDDVSEIHRLLEEQESVNEQLEGENDLLMAENQVREEKARVDTKNRLYDHITKEVETQLVRLDDLLRQDGGSPKRRLSEICVLGAYIKRRSNLILLSENKPYISAAELSYCFTESVNNLETTGAVCSLMADCKGTLHIKTALAVYDFFEAVVEQVLPALGSALIHLTAGNGAVTLRMMLDCGEPAAAISALPQYRYLLEQGGQCELAESEGELQLSVSLTEGGDIQ